MTRQHWTIDADEKLKEMFDDLPEYEINNIISIMAINFETEVTCKLVDDITNWVYEDTEVLMPVKEAYIRIQNGEFNE